MLTSWRPERTVRTKKSLPLLDISLVDTTTTLSTNLLVRLSHSLMPCPPLTSAMQLIGIPSATACSIK